VHESSDLSSEEIVIIRGSSIPKHKSSIDGGICGVDSICDRLKRREGNEPARSGFGTSRCTDVELDVLVDRVSQRPSGPNVEVKVSGVFVDSTVIVIELNPNVIEPRRLKG